MSHSYEEAIDSPRSENWCRAVNEEIESIAKSNVWTLVDRSLCKNRPLETGWIFGAKLTETGDADRARCTETGTSVSGGVATIDQLPIIWYSRKQRVIATSTTEAEYVAAHDIAREGVWLKRLAEDLGCDCSQLTTLYCDNEVACKLISGDANPRRTKHIDLKYHYVRSICANGLIRIERVPTDEQVADLFTKPLPQETFCKFCKALFIL